MESNAVVLFPQPRVVVIEDEPIPSPGDGEMLVKTQCTLISTGTELSILSGEFAPGSAWSAYGRFPFRPGYDNVGVVVEAGREVDRDWIGRTVCSYGPHAAYFTLTPGAVYPPPPDGVLNEQAVFFTLAEIAMIGIRRSGVQIGEAVAIYGAGLLGQLTARLCRLCGARPVVAIDVAPARLRFLPDDPAVIPVDAREEDAVEVVNRATKGRKADIVFELTGNPDIIPREFAVLRNQGRFVVLSSPRGASQFDFHDLCNAPSFTIIGAHNGSHPETETPGNPWTKKRDVELFFDLLAAGDISVDGLISHRERYTEAPRIYKMLLEDRSEAMGVVFDWA